MERTIVFDLDDTLIKEVDFLKSAFSEIAYYIDADSKFLYNQMLMWYFAKEDVFKNIVKIYPNVKINFLKNMYRMHYPNFEKYYFLRDLLSELKQNGNKLGLITDGFSITQRNKIDSLNIQHLFDLIIISEEFGSEKPCEKNYIVFHQFKSESYYYIGDNFNKDFITPNRLGWNTIGVIDDGRNIHIQEKSLSKSYLPKKFINHINEIINIFK
jgi:putative hydrolase of the HAD superfamily